MKQKKQTVKPNKGQAELCNSCACQFLHPEGHEMPCSVAPYADLHLASLNGTPHEACNRYFERITTKEEVHEMNEKQNPAIKQPSTQVALAGPAQVKLGYTFTPEDGQRKFTLNLAIPISESDLDEVRFLTKQSGNWFVTLGVEGIQASMDEALAQQSDEPMNLDAGQESRIEEAAGQRAG